ncbi:AMP-binding protein [Desulfogranum japonicum]|uniref:AMP-binding protein n=1 Tax=Desulfogranum japonicum TaxID=231447 RepID=UPI000406301C|nr:AMP-binding protein [Desulfogranum japonicum]
MHTPSSESSTIQASGCPLSDTCKPNCGSSLSNEDICEVASKLAMELDPAARERQFTLDSSLERDLGFDSLTKVEFLTRLEKISGIALGEQTLGSAETLRDIARAITQHVPSQEQNNLDQQQIHTSPRQTGIAHSARTLVELLNLQADALPEQVHLIYYLQKDSPVTLSYGELRKQARTIAQGLQDHEVQPGARVALMLPTGLDYFFCFFGILMAGAVPVPLYPPARPSQIEDHLRRHNHILNNCQAELLITFADVIPLARFLKAQVSSLREILTAAQLQSAESSSPTSLPHIQPEHTAFLQYTSGSTGIPKGVILTHSNLLTNIRTMGRVIQAGPHDVFVSWLPLYHDMGLIGAWLGSLYHGCELVIMSPLSFLAHPERWLWAIHHHKGTLSASPNFGYEFCLNKIDDQRLEGLDLSSWRMAFNGAEPVSPQTIRRFGKRFSKYGFKSTAMSPVYGLAESSVGLAFPPPDRGPLFDTVQRHAFLQRGKALPAPPEENKPLVFVSSGRVLPGHQLRIVDANDHELPDRRIGHLQFTGPSATSGYYRNPDKTKELFHGTWLDSGDLAYMADQELYLTSRVKDIIIRAGRNISPYELEEAIGAIKGIRKGCVAVFGVIHQATATERLIVLAESREKDPVALKTLRQKIIHRSVDILGMPPDEVILARPGSVLKTSSGKIRRTASKELYEKGQIGRPPRALWMQLMSMTLRSILQQGKQALRLMATSLYAAYCWLLFGVLSLMAACLVFILPGKKFCWYIARMTSRLLARLTGTTISVKGREHINLQKPRILVVNHQSYLDSLILMAVLPGHFSYVAKAELAKNTLLRFFLRRLNVIFVERFESMKALADAKRINEHAARGNTICIFAEGTCKRMPGLLPFHMGAFLIAAENTMEVLPLTLRGTRSKLRCGSWFPRAGNVHLHIGAPLSPKGKDWQAALDLRNRTRAYILHHCGEQDMDQQPLEVEP